MKKRMRGKFFTFDETALIYGLAVLVFLVTLGLVSWFSCQYFAGRSFPAAVLEPGGKAAKKTCDYRRLLDGVCVETKSRANPKLAAVMIDNHMDARPLAGLSHAMVVYEAPVEGNFTRFMAIYPSDAQVKKAGPVRSARPYFLDWVSEYGGVIYLHCGGSLEALQKIKDYELNDLNEFYRGWYYWRDNDRLAPHNIFTSSELWNKALADYGDNYGTESYDGWRFGRVKKCGIDCVTKITIIFSSSAFKAVWKFNSSTEKYERYQAGRMHKDQDGQLITADTLIAQKVNTAVLDDIGRLGMETIGNGEAIIFAGGNVIQGGWEKESRTRRTKWFDELGEEVTLQPGKIWVEVINQASEIIWE